MTKSVCVLGKDDSWYTKAVLLNLDELGIKYSIIYEKNDESVTPPKKTVFNTFTRFIRIMNSGTFKYIENYRFYKHIKLIKYIIFKQSKFYEKIVNKYFEYDQFCDDCYYVQSFNSRGCQKLISDKSFDIGLFADVPIIDGNVISRFSIGCLNAHPAPLPECRGGGALQNTLAYGLWPSVSVHYATPEVDDGDILRITKVKLNKKDTIDSIAIKLTILCASEIAKTTKKILAGEKINVRKNVGGKLHYWQDCNIQLQKKADLFLKKILNSLS